MFDSDDPLLKRFRRIALGFPGTQEKISHGRPAFFTQKVFAYYGWSQKVSGTYVNHQQAFPVWLPSDERAAVLELDYAWAPPYLANAGWVALDLFKGAQSSKEGGAAEDDGGQPDWQEVAELLDFSYRGTAPANLIRELDRSELPSTD